jgi:hypothetical protein
MELVFFFDAGGSSRMDVTSEHIERISESAAASKHPVEWPVRAARAEIALFYSEKEVAATSINRRPKAPTIRLAADEYFDPDRERLRKALLDREDTDSRDFEHGVVRLMNLLGVPLIWYGGKVKASRSDSAATVAAPNDLKALVLLVECTVSKPKDKFSQILERAERLHQLLDGEAEILPAVFAKCLAVAEEDDARTHGIALVHSVHLQTLYSMLQEPSPAEAAVRYLKELSHSLEGFGGPWNGPWRRTGFP